MSRYLLSCSIRLTEETSHGDVIYFSALRNQCKDLYTTNCELPDIVTLSMH